jgi:endonuclease/exonuclease/phosphatase (EEP) superfamily protein YafD
MTSESAPGTTSERRRPQSHRASAPRKRRRWFSVPAWFVVLGCYAVIVFAFAWPQDFHNSSPAYVRVATAAFMVRTFLFHIGVTLLVVTAVLAVLRAWRLLIATLPLVVFLVGPGVWRYVPKPRPEVAGEPVTIMSVNLLANNPLTDRMVAEAAAVRPDLLVLQEYSFHWHEAFQAALGDDYPHTAFVRRNDSFGLAIYSRRPFVGPADMSLRFGTVSLPQGRIVIRIADRDVVLYNVHLMPPRSHAWAVEQRRQFADLLELLEREKLPTIVCGDFNFTNASAFAWKLRRRGLIDAHLLSGYGRGATWPARGPFRWFPGVRIDHVFISEEFTSTRSEVGRCPGSDHYPIVVEIGLAR